jgi:hypothetical protein
MASEAGLIHALWKSRIGQPRKRERENYVRMVRYIFNSGFAGSVVGIRGNCRGGCRNRENPVYYLPGPFPGVAVRRPAACVKRKSASKAAVLKQKVNMNKSLVNALFVWGFALTVFGINASEAFGIDGYRIFAGAPGDQSVSILTGGIGLAVLGFVLSGRSFRF